MHLALAVTALFVADAHVDDAARLAADAWPHVGASTNLALSPPSLRAMIALLRAGAAGRTGAELDALAGKSALDTAVAGATTIAVAPGVAVLDSYRNDVKPLHATFTASAAGTHALTIANQVSFHGTWREPFDAKLTSNDPFHVDAKHVKTVPMMYAKSLLDGAHGADFDVVAIPYDDGGDLVVVVPKKLDGLAALERGGVKLARFTARLQRTPVEISLPRFSIASTVNLDDTLRALGMKHAFCADLASGVDWSKLATASDALCLGDVVHEVHVDVDEHGTTASGSTMSTFELAEGEPEGALRVVADRPFLFFIRDAKGNELFAGRVVDPAPKETPK